jgi:hypothetical protein
MLPDIAKTIIKRNYNTVLYMIVQHAIEMAKEATQSKIDETLVLHNIEELELNIIDNIIIKVKVSKEAYRRLKNRLAYSRIQSHEWASEYTEWKLTQQQQQEPIVQSYYDQLVQAIFSSNDQKSHETSLAQLMQLGQTQHNIGLDNMTTLSQNTDTTKGHEQLNAPQTTNTANNKNNIGTSTNTKNNKTVSTKYYNPEDTTTQNVGNIYTTDNDTNSPNYMDIHQSIDAITSEDNNNPQQLSSHTIVSVPLQQATSSTNDKVTATPTSTTTTKAVIQQQSTAQEAGANTTLAYNITSTMISNNSTNVKGHGQQRQGNPNTTLTVAKNDKVAPITQTTPNSGGYTKEIHITKAGRQDQYYVGPNNKVLTREDIKREILAYPKRDWGQALEYTPVPQWCPAGESCRNGEYCHLMHPIHWFGYPVKYRGNFYGCVNVADEIKVNPDLEPNGKYHASDLKGENTSNLLGVIMDQNVCM